jgi:hypothetical protein
VGDHVNPQQPRPSGKRSAHQLTSWFNERFENSDLSLAELDEIEGAEGDGFRLIRYALNALEVEPEHKEVQHLHNPAWTYRCTVTSLIQSRHRICVLHVPRSLFDQAPRNDLDRLEVAVEHIWRRLHSSHERSINKILIFSWRSRTLRRALLHLQEFERTREVLIDFRSWVDVQELIDRVKSYGRQITKNDLKALVDDPDLGFEIEILEFFGIPTY